MEPPKPKSKPPLSQPSPKPQASGPSKGQIHVKLIQARGLNVPSLQARPYVVVQFEQNEFVSRDPADETDKEVKGVATTLSRNSSSTALASLNAISNRSSPDKRNGSVTPNGRVPNSQPSAQTKSLLSSKTNGILGSALRSAHNPVWKHEVSFDVTSEESHLVCNIYDRSEDTHSFLGTVQIKPTLVHDHTVDHWYKLTPLENEPVTGEMRVQITFEAYKSKRALTPRDFEFLKLIGRGTFGKVFQVRKRDTKRIYAMKVLSKKEIVAKKEVAHTIGERKILQRSLDSPFLVGLKFSFQTDSDLYLVTDFKSGGELFWHLQKETRFSEERARFYIAELILALEHLHKYDIVYRDLKPENILLDATGHVALCDFGLSKPDLRADQLTNTFCGTTEYLAPEVLLDEHGYSKMVDWWSLGVLLFEMCCGWSPFYAEDTQQMYKNICFGKIRFPRGVINEDGKQFVKGLLNRNPKHRLGAQRDAAELKDHTFFAPIDWKALSLKQVTPPFKPVVESDESVANFDPEFTTMDLNDSGLGVNDFLDDNDPSEAWVSCSASQTHLPNGPLGSDTGGRKPSGGGLGGFGMTSISSLKPRGIEISKNAQKKGVTINRGSGGSKGSRGRRDDSPPLTSSVQENFRGFTYHGEDAGDLISAAIGRLRGENGTEDAVDDDELYEPTTEDEVENDAKPAGRYANQRRRGQIDDF
ncbi:kinase-like protein [Thelephora ganbajun]|uniref:Kinase-like protein n=1 Tax=Thelephora ganbajun TaxID=370292 RepID=A0ACB6ZUR7_THEGA|nr:kinase-like protein [Thelephora ganbajun]